MNISELALSVRNEFLTLVMIVIHTVEFSFHLNIEMGTVFPIWRRGFSSKLISSMNKLHKSFIYELLSFYSEKLNDLFKLKIFHLI